MNQVREAYTIPEAPEPILRRWSGYLTPVLGALGWRVNRCLAKDGSERMTGPLPLAVYTTATLPPASAWIGTIVFVSDAPGGHQLQGSDGTSWVALS